MNLKYIEWQKSLEARKTITEFSDYIGFPQSTVSFWMNGDRVPKKAEDKVKLASVIGFEIYDALEEQRPDEDLHYLQTHWNQYSPEKRRRIREQAESYAAENKKKKK